MVPAVLDHLCPWLRLRSTRRAAERLREDFVETRADPRIVYHPQLQRAFARESDLAPRGGMQPGEDGIRRRSEIHANSVRVQPRACGLGEPEATHGGIARIHLRTVTVEGVDVQPHDATVP